MWPALILAARRNERVMGRTEILEDSIRTRKGFSQDGAPPGKSMAMNFIGEDKSDEIINLSQSVRPNENVKIRWLEVLNVYGVSLLRFE